MFCKYGLFFLMKCEKIIFCYKTNKKELLKIYYNQRIIQRRCQFVQGWLNTEKNG